MSSLRSSIEQQLNEIELLRCCYSSADEFSLDDFEAVDEAKAFLEKQTDHFQRNLSFILKLQLGQKKVSRSTLRGLFDAFSPRRRSNCSLSIHCIIRQCPSIFICARIYRASPMRDSMKQCRNFCKIKPHPKNPTSWNFSPGCKTMKIYCFSPSRREQQQPPATIPRRRNHLSMHVSGSTAIIYSVPINDEISSSGHINYIWMASHCRANRESSASKVKRLTLTSTGHVCDTWIGKSCRSKRKNFSAISKSRREQIERVSNSFRSSPSCTTTVAKETSASSISFCKIDNWNACSMSISVSMGPRRNEIFHRSALNDRLLPSRARERHFGVLIVVPLEIKIDFLIWFSFFDRSRHSLTLSALGQHPLDDSVYTHGARVYFSRRVLACEER